jgi:hypothetical protein
MLQKRMPVHGRTVILGPLRIRSEMREAEGQLVQGGDLSDTSLYLTLKGLRDK